MAIMITDECINCGACEPECPNNAIYEGGAEWKFTDGTTLKGLIQTLDGEEIEADHAFEPVNMDVYFIAHEKCTECVGFHDEPQCAAVCPVDCCVDDEDVRETKDELLSKKELRSKFTVLMRSATTSNVITKKVRKVLDSNEIKSVRLKAEYTTRSVDFKNCSSCDQH